MESRGFLPKSEGSTYNHFLDQSQEERSDYVLTEPSLKAESPLLGRKTFILRFLAAELMQELVGVSGPLARRSLACLCAAALGCQRPRKAENQLS